METGLGLALRWRHVHRLHEGCHLANWFCRPWIAPGTPDNVSIFSWIAAKESTIFSTLLCKVKRGWIFITNLESLESNSLTFKWRLSISFCWASSIAEGAAGPEAEGGVCVELRRVDKRCLASKIETLLALANLSAFECEMYAGHRGLPVRYGDLSDNLNTWPCFHSWRPVGDCHRSWDI